MNPFYTEAFAGQAGQTARADQVKSQLAAIATAFDNANIVLLRSIKAPGTEAPLDLPVAANRANKFLKFDASGNPEAIQSGGLWRGDWTASTVYQFGDTVRFGIYGSIYTTTIAHTSGASFDVSKFSIQIDLTGINIIRNEIKTASFTAIVGGDYMVDSAGGNIVVTLPVAPTILDAPVNITHIGGTLVDGQTVTIARNGKLIMGLAEDLTIDKVNSSFSLMFANDAKGWRLRVLA